MYFWLRWNHIVFNFLEKHKSSRTLQLHLLLPTLGTIIALSFHSMNCLNYMRYNITGIYSQYLFLFTHISNLIGNCSFLQFGIISVFENSFILHEFEENCCLPNNSGLVAIFFYQFENIISLLYLHLCREVSRNQKSVLFLLFWRQSVLFLQLFLNISSLSLIPSNFTMMSLVVVYFSFIFAWGSLFLLNLRLNFFSFLALGTFWPLSLQLLLWPLSLSITVGIPTACPMSFIYSFLYFPSLHFFAKRCGCGPPGIRLKSTAVEKPKMHEQSTDSHCPMS